MFDRIALMIKNRSNDSLCKTNLIMAPLALLDQWKLEIELKSSDSLKCIVYHGRRSSALTVAAHHASNFACPNQDRGSQSTSKTC